MCSAYKGNQWFSFLPPLCCAFWSSKLAQALLPFISCPNLHTRDSPREVTHFVCETVIDLQDRWVRASQRRGTGLSVSGRGHGVGCLRAHGWGPGGGDGWKGYSVTQREQVDGEKRGSRWTWRRPGGAASGGITHLEKASAGSVLGARPAEGVICGTERGGSPIIQKTLWKELMFVCF